MSGVAREYIDSLIRSQVDESEVERLVKKLYGFKTTGIKKLDSYLGQNFVVKVQEEHTNPHINELWPHGFVFKIANNADSLTDHIDAQIACLAHLTSYGYHVSQPVPAVNGKFTNLELLRRKANDSSEHAEGGSPKLIKHMIYMLTFMPGTMLDELPITTDMLYQVGRFAGRLDRDMQSFSHPGVANVNMVGSNMAYIVPQMDQLFSVIPDKDDRELAEKLLKIFNEEVLPNCHKFKKGVIHGDLTPHNLLIPAGLDITNTFPQCEEYGVIDFGDMNDSYHVFQVGVTIMQFMLHCTAVDAASIGGHVLAGYLKENSLSDEEIQVLRDVVLGRFVHSVVLGTYIYSKEPWNEYILEFINNGWAQVKKLYVVPKETIYKNWMKIVESYI